MKLNDPFGRMERRHQMGYQAVRDSLQRSGIDSEEAARQVITDTRKRALIFIAAAVLLTSAAKLLFPAALLAVSAICMLLAAWVISWTINGKRYVERYIREELHGERQEELGPKQQDPEEP